jgi:predicted nucleic acid-binding protein
VAVFADTSALYAALNARDVNHLAAKEGWTNLAEQRETVVTSNYVLVETIALIERRLGFQAVRDFISTFLPVLNVHWVDRHVHERAVAALLVSGNRDLSLVDCVSFEVMRSLGIDTAFAFDKHFQEQGFRSLI